MKTVTTNACKLCAALGACIAFRGVKGAIPFLHGSQGCATYIRRYIISHFREPIDIASSSFSEESAIFGGGENLKKGLDNVALQYKPKLIGIATTCLSETIGDDVSLFLRQYKQGALGNDTPLLVCASTPSYRGTHIDGFHQAVRALVEFLAREGRRENRLNIFCGFLSCADIRYLKEIVEDFDFLYSLLPDYSETLDSPIAAEYKKIPEGGTSVEDIVNMGGASATLEFGSALLNTDSPGRVLFKNFGIPLYNLGLPVGINETDKFFATLKELSKKPLPKKYELERGRLIDSYVDAHKYVFEKRAVVYGEEDLVCGISSFLSEIGIKSVLCACGEKTDFAQIAEEAEKLSPDFLIGSSKGYHFSRKLNIPLVRVGFPIHDRIGAQRILHLGYRGAQELFDRIVNALIEKKQDSSTVGYSYV